jgi:ATP-dependent exoDNAse (exonuclease V) beta subunit
MIVPETKPAVKIMTIHKAKGLEFPVVIIPYANWGHDMDRQLWLIPEPPLPGIPPNLALPVKTPKLLEETFFGNAFKKEKEKVSIDNINLLYVAFTRAEDNLYIIAQPKRKNDNYDLLRELAVPLMEKEAAVEDAYTIGEPAAKEKKEAGEVAFPGIGFRENDTFLSNKWYGKISIRRKTPEFWGFDTRAERRNWGILVHHALSRVRTIEDLPYVLETISISGDIEAGEKEVLAKKIGEIFEIEAVRGWFRPGLQVFNEAPILTGHEILVPDRVVIDDEKVVIIDFKTGEKSSGHTKQVNKYRDALRGMGYEKIEAYLFYLENKEIQQVTAHA